MTSETSMTTQWPCNRNRFIGSTYHIYGLFFRGYSPKISPNIWYERTSILGSWVVPMGKYMDGFLSWEKKAITIYYNPNDGSYTLQDGAPQICKLVYKP